MRCVDVGCRSCEEFARPFCRSSVCLLPQALRNTKNFGDSHQYSSSQTATLSMLHLSPNFHATRDLEPSSAHSHRREIRMRGLWQIIHAKIRSTHASYARALSWPERLIFAVRTRFEETESSARPARFSGSHAVSTCHWSLAFTKYLILCTSSYLITTQERAECILHVSTVT